MFRSKAHFLQKHPQLKSYNPIFKLNLQIAPVIKNLRFIHTFLIPSKIILHY